MTAAVYGAGPREFELTRNDEGQRDYRVVWQVQTNDRLDGPLSIAFATGLPSVGSTLSIGNDVDPWAFCTPYLKASPRQKNETCYIWDVEQKFTTIPTKRCQDTSIENPLSEPPKLSGSFVKYTKEATRDRFGTLVCNSAFEMYRGPQVEFDHNRPQVNISINTLNLDLGLLASAVDNVNDATLWGMSPRCVKLSDVSWERKLYGVCTFYYTINYGFDISYEGFDRIIPDEGTKCINGQWSSTGDTWELKPVYEGGPMPDPTNPSHYTKYKDRKGEISRVMLNGAGYPATTAPYNFTLSYYPQSNLLLLGIPSSLA